MFVIVYTLRTLIIILYQSQKFESDSVKGT